MNLKIVMICLGAMLLAHESDAFGGFLFNRFGRFGGLGLGGFGYPFGGLGFGGFGYPGFGFGGLGFGGFGFGGGFGRFGGGFRGGRHGREVEGNLTQCIISSENKKIICTGVNELTCDLVQNFTAIAKPFAFVIKDLTITPMGEDFHLFGQKEVDHKIITEDQTFIDPVSNKPVTIALFVNEENVNESGFKFVEPACWAKFESIVKSVVKPEELEFEVSISSE
jgi:hypothetical protein